MTEVLGGTSGDERIVELDASEPVDIAEGAAIIEEAVLEPAKTVIIDTTLAAGTEVMGHLVGMLLAGTPTRLPNDGYPATVNTNVITVGVAPWRPSISASTTN